MSFREFAVDAVARLFCAIVALCCFMLAFGVPGWGVQAFFNGAMIGAFISLLLCYVHYRWMEGDGLWWLLMLVRVPPPVAVIVTYSPDAKHLIRFLRK